MYSDIDKFFTSDGFHTKMYADSGKDEELTISLLGDGGTYRLSFYINNELMPVFDGKSYIDVVTSEENQTDLKVNIFCMKKFQSPSSLLRSTEVLRFISL